MQHSDPRVRPEDFRAHASFLRALAARLVADEHRAEDLVQDTWVAALERPPKSSGSVRAWLARVARNLASNARRGEARRARREEQVARGEAQPSAEQALEWLELSRTLSEHVLSLREAYRTTIYLRYYEGLSPKQIAERLDVPEKTVKSRLSRAIAELRLRLDRDAGGRDRWHARILAMAFLRGAEAAPAATLAGWLGGATVMKKAVLTLAVVLFGLFGWQRMRMSAPSAADDAARPTNAPVGKPEEIVDPRDRGTDERTAALPSATASGPRADGTPGREVLLALARWPDGKQIARAVVGLAFDGSPNAADGPRFSDADGRLVVEAPRGARVVEVEVAGFELETVDLSTAVRASVEHELRLRPLSGLFGRLVFESGEPVGGARVRLVRAIETTAVSASGGGSPQVIVNKFDSTGASTTTTSKGWYFLEWPTRTSSERVELLCGVEDGRQGRLVVQLPRPTERLPDIALGEPEGLLLKVLDEDNRPVAGANVWGRDAEGQGLAGKRSDSRGECWILDPALPATYTATTPSAVLRSVRIDGVEHDPGHPVESIDQRVELILRRAPTAVFLVVDQVDPTPVRSARGSIDFLDPAGQRVARIDLETDRQGRLEVILSPRNHPPEQPITRIRLSFWATEGYEDAIHEFDVVELSDGEPRTLELVPISRTHLLRGRVLREGKPQPGFDVGVIGILPRGSAESRMTSGVRCVTDDQGRFSVRWSPRHPGEFVAVRPHWKNWEEFGALGPMPVAEAVGRELVLEIEHGLRVPAIVRGVTQGGQYLAFVSAVRGENLVPITINGAPIEAWQEGEIRTHVFVPSAWPSRLTMGYTTQNGIRPEVSQPVFFDPAAPALPLVFDLEPIFARIEGSVVGVDPAQIPALRVVAVRSRVADLGSQWSVDQDVLATTGPSEDGSFALEHVPMGACNVLLVRKGQGSSATVLASESVQVGLDVTGLVLRP